MLNVRPLRRQGVRDLLKVLLTVRFEGAEDDALVAHDVCRNVGKVGGPECVLGVHDPQVLVDQAQGLGAQPAQAGDQKADD